MKHSAILPLFGAALLMVSGAAYAQTGAEFIDSDGDGICDNVAIGHVAQQLHARGGQRNPAATGDGQYVAERRLTDEQRLEIQALVTSLNADGLTREEIASAVSEQYDEWGKVMPGRKFGAQQDGAVNGGAGRSGSGGGHGRGSGERIHATN